MGRVRGGLLARLGRVTVIEGQRSQPLGPVGPLNTVVQYVQEKVLEEHGPTIAGARSSPAKRQQLKTLLARIILTENITCPGLTHDGLVEYLANEITGYGPLEPLLGDEAVTEILVNHWAEVYVEKEGRLELTGVTFRDNHHLEEVIARIVAPLGRRIDHASPFVDGRLPDGSRVNAVIPPLALKGPALSIRKFSRHINSMADLLARGTLNEEMAQFLEASVRARLNIIICGGAGCGKTTTLNVLASCIPPGSERVITIEDAAELQLTGQHVVSLESRPPNMEGKGEITIRQLLRNSLRMRPDRIIIGEVRGAEAYDMLQAMNTGHEGSLSTIHANNPLDAIRRLENMLLMAGENLPHPVIRDHIRSALDLIVYQARRDDGSRRIMEVALVEKEGRAAPRSTLGWTRRERLSLQRLFWYEDGFMKAAEPGWPLSLVEKFQRAGLDIPCW